MVITAGNKAMEASINGNVLIKKYVSRKIAVHTTVTEWVTSTDETNIL